MPEIRRRYESAGLGNALTPGRRPAVLVVDLIHGFTDPSFPAGSNQDEVIHSTRELLDLARAAAVPDGCMAGYRVFVPRECVGDRALGPHEANLFDIDAKYGDVIDLRRACELVRPDQLLKERN